MGEGNKFTPPPDWDWQDLELEQLVEKLEQIGNSKLALQIAQQAKAHHILFQQVSTSNAALAHRIREDDENRHLENVISLQAGLFDKGASYNTVVLTLGYAGMFGIWSNVRDLLSPGASASVAILLGVSLVSFVAWTLVLSIVHARNIRQRALVLKEEFETRRDFLDAALAKERTIDKATNCLQRWWVFVFSFTVATGFGAAVILLIKMAQKIVGTLEGHAQ